MGKSSIEWTDETWNPVTGCEKVSPGCKHCYAETFAERFRGVVMPSGRLHAFHDGFDPTLRPDRIKQPLSWKKPRRVFVNSMSDLFGEFVPDEYLAEIFNVMRMTPQHTYQILTKRAERLESLTRGMPWLSEARHMWLGVSVEDKKYGKPRINHLRRATAAIRFLSIEPLLEDIGELGLTHIDWVIVGGESGHGARAFDLTWARDVVAQCYRAGVACFVKQLGANPFDSCGPTVDGVRITEVSLVDRKGGDMSEWPERLRVRQFPKARP